MFGGQKNYMKVSNGVKVCLAGFFPVRRRRKPLVRAHGSLEAGSA